MARSTFINPLDLNIEDSKQIDLIDASRQFKIESNFSHNDTIMNPLERNITVNDTNSQSMTHQNQSKIDENQNDSGLVYLIKVKTFLFLLDFFNELKC